VDTDVLIEYLRGDPRAIAFLEELTDAPLVSVISVAELYSGVRTNERPALAAFLQAVEVVPVDLAAATLAGEFRLAYGKSHGVKIPDSLIAETAKQRSARLITLNLKHFPMLTDAEVPYSLI
jgi:predicted nucleic acid-binding protein